MAWGGAPSGLITARDRAQTGCPKHVWDGVEHENQPTQTWEGHVLHVWSTVVGNGLYGLQRPFLSVRVTQPVASAVNHRDSHEVRSDQEELAGNQGEGRASVTRANCLDSPEVDLFRQGFTLYLGLVTNFMCSSSWPPTCGDSPASVS